MEPKILYFTTKKFDRDAFCLGMKIPRRQITFVSDIYTFTAQSGNPDFTQLWNDISLEKDAETRMQLNFLRKPEDCSTSTLPDNTRIRIFH